MTDAIKQLLDSPYMFGDRPAALPGEFRPVWRVCLLILLLDHCRGGKASLEQLHVMNWAMRSKQGRVALQGLLEGKHEPEETIVRFDPTLSRAVEFAIAEGLITTSGTGSSQSANNYRISLTLVGVALLAKIREDPDVFVDEKAFLKSIGRLSQTSIKDLFA